MGKWPLVKQWARWAGVTTARPARTGSRGGDGGGLDLPGFGNLEGLVSSKSSQVKSSQVKSSQVKSSQVKSSQNSLSVRLLLSSVLCLGGVLISPWAYAGLHDGLVAHYCFDDPTNIGKDCSSNGNNGTPTGTVNTVAGWQGNAAGFGGYYNPASIRVPNSSSLQFASDATFSFAVKMTGFNGMDGWGRYSASGAHSIIAKSHDRSGISFLVGGNESSGNFGTWIGSYQWADSNIGLSLT